MVKIKAICKNLISKIIKKYGYNIHKIDNIYKLKSTNFKGDFSKFDFIIFGIGRIGSKALQNFINLHPEIFTISRKELDKYIQFKLTRDNLKIEDLAKNYFDKIQWLKKNNLKSVLVIHSTNGIYTKDNLEKFSKIAKNSILITRNPLEVLKSLYNHGLYNSFHPRGYFLNGWTNNENHNNARFNKLCLERHRNYFSKSIKSLNYFQISEQLKYYFEKSYILDFKILKNSENIQSLFKIIGVNKFFHPAFNETQNGVLERYFRYNFIKVFIAESFYLRLRFSINAEHIDSNDENLWHEIFSFNLKNKMKINQREISQVRVLCEQNNLDKVLLEDKKFLNGTYINLQEIEEEFIKMVNKIKKIELLYSKVKKKYYEDIFLNTYNDNKDDLSNEINKFISQYPEFKSYGNYL